MGNTLTSPKGGPLFSDTPTQTSTDLNAGRIFTEKMGNHRADTGANRTGAGGLEVFEGLTWEDTTDGNTYKYMAGAWVLWSTPIVTGTLVARTNFTLNTSDTDLVRRNGFTTLQVHLTKNANFANADICADIPSGFRPAKTIFTSGGIFNVGVTTSAVIKIDTAGAITVFVQGGASTELTFSITFRHA